VKIKMFEKVNVVDTDGDVKFENFMVEFSDVMELEEYLSARKAKKPGRIQHCQPHNEYFLEPGLVANEVSRSVLSITRTPVVTFDQYKGKISDEQRRFARREDYDGFAEWEKRLIGKVELPKQGGTKMFEYTVSYYEIVDGKLYTIESYNGTNRKEAAKFIKIANEDLGGHIDIRLLWKEETRDERLHRILEEKVRAEREALRKP